MSGQHKLSEAVAQILRHPVEDLELSMRSYNCLKNANIQTIGDLVHKTEAEMLRTKNFGRRSLNEIKEVLGGLGLSFGMQFVRFVDGYQESPPIIRIAQRADDQQTLDPPTQAEYLLSLLLSKNQREYIIGDLAEEYATTVLPRFGVRKAKFWYWKQVLSSICPILWPRLRRILLLTGFLKTFHELLRRFGS